MGPISRPFKADKIFLSRNVSRLDLKLSWTSILCWRKKLLSFTYVTDFLYELCNTTEGMWKCFSLRCHSMFTIIKSDICEVSRGRFLFQIYTHKTNIPTDIYCGFPQSLCTDAVIECWVVIVSTHKIPKLYFTKWINRQTVQNELLNAKLNKVK
jgi:hypothetical protein